MSIQVSSQRLTKADYGRMGGLTTALRHGSEHMSRISRMRKTYAGRPRLKTLEELGQESTQESQTIKEEELPHSLRGLRELWTLQQRSRQSVINEDGLDCQEELQPSPVQAGKEF